MHNCYGRAEHVNLRCFGVTAKDRRRSEDEANDLLMDFLPFNIFDSVLGLRLNGQKHP